MDCGTVLGKTVHCRLSSLRLCDLLPPSPVFQGVGGRVTDRKRRLLMWHVWATETINDDNNNDDNNNNDDIMRMLIIIMIIIVVICAPLLLPPNTAPHLRHS